MKKNVNSNKLAQHMNVEKNILQYSILSELELFEKFGTGKDGLTETQAEVIKERVGENTISYGIQHSLIVKFLLSFASPFTLVLLLVASVSFFTEYLFAQESEKSWATVIIILTLVSISGVLKFVQELKSGNAAQKLKDMVSSNALVVREGVASEIPMHDVVPGDIVLLSSGDMIPADVRILSAKDLFISESALTGESGPVEKFGQAHNPGRTPENALEAETIGFMGCNVISGTASSVVCGTGNNTYFGTIAKDLTAKKAVTSFERGIADVSKLLLQLMFVMVPVIFIINGVTKNDWLNAFLFAMSVAVGITPELLPMIMTSTLARGAIAMSRRKTIVKDLSSIQSFGAMDVLCTDKTGTLTEDRIILERYLNLEGLEDMRIWQHAYLNSYFQTGIKSLIDKAIIARAVKEGHLHWDEKYKKVDEIPFDFERRRLSVVLEDTSGKRQLITKGAVEEMLDICAFADSKGQIIDISEGIRKNVLDEVSALNRQGLRVLAVAQKNEVHDIHTFGVQDESAMVLIGFVAFLDPPKESAVKAIAALHEHNVRVVVLTGDNEHVASLICSRVGLKAKGFLLGAQIEEMSDEELSFAIEETELFAKLSPSQKSRIVRLFQKNGHVVGYMGDGINDAPALHQSDVGISVDSGVDIAKESANIILLEKDLMVLKDGVVEGRRTFGNIVKYIKMASSGNFGNMFSVLSASIFLPFLPMLPLQILAQNMLYDFSQIAIPFDQLDEEYIKKPQKWDAKSIRRFMFFLGPISSMFDIISFIVLYFIFHYNNLEKQAFFQTGWFMVGLLSQTLIVHLIRTAKIPFIESRAAMPLIISTVLVVIAGLILPYTYVGGMLDLVPVSLWYIPCIFVILIAYASTVQIVKKVYIRKFAEWI